MCCFSGPVQDVAATRIFARATSATRQALVYEMQITSTEPVAMILPLPVPPNSGEDAVRFVSLEAYPDVFEDMYRAFPSPRRSTGRMKIETSLAIAVHAVGAYEASFVPSWDDFDRLDPRFRIPPGTIDRVDAYRDWGFVVFQLAPTRGRSRVHPIALEFTTRDPDRLFFPLVHVHDGTLHQRIDMDHVLYAQGVDQLRTFEAMDTPARRHVRCDRTGGLVDPAARLARYEMIGEYPNRDLWAALR